jgi:hypothetical protein
MISRSRPNLTLTAGLRYEYTTNFTESNGREAMFDIGTGKIVVPNGSLGKVSPLLPSGYVGVVEAKDVGLPGDTLLHATNKFRTAHRSRLPPWGNNTVFRAGYGIFFDMVPRGVTAGGTPFLINEPAYTNPAVPTVIFPRVFPETPLGPTTISIPNAVNPNLRRPFSMQYTATIEHQHWNTASVSPTSEPIRVRGSGATTSTSPFPIRACSWISRGCSPTIPPSAMSPTERAISITRSPSPRNAA